MKSKVILYICAGLTVAIVAGLIATINEYGWPQELNAIGDSLAGFMSALAFVWLVGSTFLQREELAAMRLEYSSMKDSHRAQANSQAQEVVSKTAQLFILSLDALLKELHEKAKIQWKVCGKDLPDMTPYMFLNYLYTLCTVVDNKPKGSNDKKEFLKMTQPLSIEIALYKRKYAQLEKLLSASDQNRDVYLALVDDTVYKNINLTIANVRNLEPSSTAVRVFFNND